MKMGRDRLLEKTKKDSEYTETGGGNANSKGLHGWCNV